MGILVTYMLDFVFILFMFFASIALLGEAPNEDETSEASTLQSVEALEELQLQIRRTPTGLNVLRTADTGELYEVDLTKMNLESYDRVRIEYCDSQMVNILKLIQARGARPVLQVGTER